MTKTVFRTTGRTRRVATEAERLCPRCGGVRRGASAPSVAPPSPTVVALSVPTLVSRLLGAVTRRVVARVTLRRAALPTTQTPMRRASTGTAPAAPSLIGRIQKGVQ